MVNKSFFEKITCVILINKNTSKTLRQIELVRKTLDSESAELLRSVAETIKNKRKKLVFRNRKHIAEVFRNIFAIINKIKEGNDKVFFIKLLAYHIDNQFFSLSEWYLDKLGELDSIDDLKNKCLKTEKQVEDLTLEVKRLENKINDIFNHTEITERDVEYSFNLLKHEIEYRRILIYDCKNRLKKQTEYIRELEQFKSLIEGSDSETKENFDFYKEKSTM